MSLLQQRLWFLADVVDRGAGRALLLLLGAVWYRQRKSAAQPDLTASLSRARRAIRTDGARSSRFRMEERRRGEMGRGMRDGGKGEPDFWGLFGRPGMRDRIGLGNLIPCFDAKEQKKKQKKKHIYSKQITIIIIVKMIFIITIMTANKPFPLLGRGWPFSWDWGWPFLLFLGLVVGQLSVVRIKNYKKKKLYFLSDGGGQEDGVWPFGLRPALGVGVGPSSLVSGFASFVWL